MAKTTSTVFLLLVLAACGANHDGGPPESSPVRFDLEALASGALPDGFEVCSGAWLGGAAPDGARCILQDAKSAGPEFNVVLAGEPSLADVSVAVTVHAMSGEIDRGGGPVWRALGGRNYYIARWNPLEDNFRAYRVVDGVRTQIASADTPGVTGPQDIRVRMVGSRVEGFLGDERLLEVTDDVLADPGRTGLWTKADARTAFTDFRVRDLAGE